MGSFAEPSNRALRLIWRSEESRDFIWEVDEKGLYRYTSPSVERILGYRPDELVGKTSIIFKFLRNFYDTRIIVLYLEMRPQTLASFTRRFVGILLYNFLSNSGIPLKEDLDYLIAKSEGYIPRTVGRINSILLAVDRRRKNNIFTELLGLCDHRCS
jgi:PAS domain-containing protein